jgi:hypothetical protein
MSDVTWFYFRSEPGLYTVGFYDPANKWQPESDHSSPEEAAKRVHYLNGGDESCGQPDRDAKLLAEAQTDLLAAIETVLPYLPDRNDAKDYAATNEGRASSFQVAAIKLREVYARNK